MAKLRVTRQTELGEEIQCACCLEFWPADPEFFYFSHGSPHSYCRACYLAHPSVKIKRQRERERKAAKLAAGGQIPAQIESPA